MERYLKCPRHIEVQIVADTQGNVVHFRRTRLFLQRRHQKVWEEAPSGLTADQRHQLGNIVTQAIGKMGYRGVELLSFF